jgi:pyridoxal 5'-phosphate synthase pdxS subunit
MPHRQVPVRDSFVCGARNLGKPAAHRRGRRHDRTKGEAGTGNVVEAVRHIRTVNREIRQLVNMPVEEVTVSPRPRVSL